MFHRSPQHWPTVLLTQRMVCRETSPAQCREDRGDVVWRKIPPHPVVVGSTSTIVEPVPFVHDLGLMIDAELSMREHDVSRLSNSTSLLLSSTSSTLCSSAAMGRDVVSRLVSVFSLSRLDYCHALLADLPASTLAPVERVLHVAARLVLDLRPRDHLTPSLRVRELHWLPISQRIDYKLCLVVHKSFVGPLPAYIADMFMAAGDVPSLAALCTASNGDCTLFHPLTVDLATGLFQSLLL